MFAGYLPNILYIFIILPLYIYDTFNKLYDFSPYTPHLYIYI
jgi:hypothetical protein